MSSRYAIFLCPDPASAIWAAGCEWLGRCAATPAPRRQPAIPGVGQTLFRTITEAPGAYGFHATLKAPFRLARGFSRERLRRALRDFAAHQAAFDAPPLEVRFAAGFLVIAPQHADAHAEALAMRCVMELDRFRAPLDAEERARHEALWLTPRQRALLERWGHPFVMDEWHLHYALTGPLAPCEESVVERVAAFATEHFGAVMRDLRRIDGIALFEQASAGEAFRLVERVRLASRPPQHALIAAVQ